MKCFNHNERDAVATCKHCFKALCADCAIDTAAGVSCRGTCEQHVSSAQELMERAKTMHEKTSKAHTTNAIFTAVTGVAFQVFGILTEIRPLRIFLMSLGVIFIITSFFFYQRAREFRK